MSDWIIYTIGFTAQILFSSRLIIQWVSSEKQKKVVTPTLFWILSLLASCLLFIYGYLRDDFAIMLGQSITYFIYIRNLQLQQKWHVIVKPLRYLFYLIPLLIVIYGFNNNISDRVNLFQNEAIPFWLLLLGILAQITFTLRFVYQWIFSENQKKSVLPFGFWILSLIGAILILIYAIFRNDYVLIIGNIFGIIIYVRNLILLHREHHIISRK